VGGKKIPDTVPTLLRTLFRYGEKRVGGKELTFFPQKLSLKFEKTHTKRENRRVEGKRLRGRVCNSDFVCTELCLDEKLLTPLMECLDI
jgi:hypothetical protein